MCGIRESSSSSGYESSEEKVGSNMEKDEESKKNAFTDGKDTEKKREAHELDNDKLPIVEKEQKYEDIIDSEKFDDNIIVNDCEKTGGEEDDPEKAEEESGLLKPEVINPSTTASHTQSQAPTSSSSSYYVPEYKQILQNLFSMFNYSKRKYPIPMYPYMKGQSSALINTPPQQQSNSSSNSSSNVTPPTNNNNGCSSH